MINEDLLILPTYELSLSSNEPLTSKTKSVPFEHGSSARVRCSLLDSGFENQTLLLTRNQRNTTQNRHGHSIIYTINQFDSNQGEEIFDCTAKRRDGKFQVRSMKFVRSRKARLSNGAKECPTNHCRNGGLCLLNDGGSSYCMCPDGYMGSSCEKSVGEIKEISESMETQRTILLAGSILLLLFLVLMAILFIREKRKTRQLKKKLVRELRKNQNIEEPLKPKDGIEEHVDLEAGGAEDADLEELYDQADGKAPIRRPTIINDYDNLKLMPEEESDNKEKEASRAAVT